MDRLRGVERFLVWLTAGSLLLPLAACGVWFFAGDIAKAQSSIDIYPAKMQDLDIPRDEVEMGAAGGSLLWNRIGCFIMLTPNDRRGCGRAAKGAFSSWEHIMDQSPADLTAGQWKR